MTCSLKKPLSISFKLILHLQRIASNQQKTNPQHQSISERAVIAVEPTATVATVTHLMGNRETTRELRIIIAIQQTLTRIFLKRQTPLHAVGTIQRLLLQSDQNPQDKVTPNYLPHHNCILLQRVDTISKNIFKYKKKSSISKNIQTSQSIRAPIKKIKREVTTIASILKIVLR